ncbi:septum formation initiator family protein [Anaerosacchariphilus polymeriproducens]|uniref:Septum formation initiator family protein n=1 Tax=Anaerosacchariphilus polymeriproducens TaxID=1812858 RepID=A0A371AY85_9FIRM|nr:septum formation initiator family protein [Anaerosacchariphilus polymeriproducens]RDU24489.1 septum formation initiator family protein [Anaerosacchariphilus polymeriproducens]
MALKSRNRKYKRRRSSNRFGMLSITVVVLLLLFVITVKSIKLHQQNKDYSAKEEYLLAKIDEESDRKKDLKEQEEYSKTKKYIEDIAKSKLGLVYENEIIFKSENE